MPALKHAQLTEGIIGAAYQVHRVLGAGFLEKVYENALVIECRERGLAVRQQVPTPVWYREHLVGEHVCDVLVEDTILVEVKAVKQLLDVHHAQVINYLRALRLEVGLLLNFGEALEVKRKILTPPG